jgi:hypothetical protein
MMPDAVVVRRNKENSREGKESVVPWRLRIEVEVAATNHSAWLYASQASCASRRTKSQLAADADM